MPLSEKQTLAEVKPHNDGSGFYVFWETWYAYGSRGSQLTKEAAEDLAARIRQGGPNAA